MDNELNGLRVIFTEFYYWVTVVMMFLIHVGFCLYEVGVSREKNKLNTLINHSMLVTIAFFLFGWWMHFAFQNGPGITGGLKSAPWSNRPVRWLGDGNVRRLWYILGGVHGLEVPQRKYEVCRPGPRPAKFG